MNRNSKNTARRILALGAVAVLLLSASGMRGCASTSHTAPSAAEEPTYDSPQAAVDALVAAVRANDNAALHKILGGEADKVLSSGDQVADTSGRAEFVRLYDEKHSLSPDGDNQMTLNAGKTDWPLPIPLVKG